MERDPWCLVGHTLSLIFFFWLRVLFSFVQPSSPLVLRLYADRFARQDVLIGTHEIIPVESQTGSFLLETWLVRLAEHLGCRLSFCPRRRRQTGWTVEPAGHTLLDSHCVAEHNTQSHIIHPRRQFPIDRSQQVVSCRSYIIYGQRLH